MHLTRRIAASMCALVLIALLGACGTTSARSTVPQATPTSTTDPAIQQYATAVQTYYQQFTSALNADLGSCRFGTGAPPPWTACQSTGTSVLTTGKALLAYLSTTTPPAQLQSVNTAMRQAVQEILSTFTKRASAVAAHNSAAFTADNLDIEQAMPLQCDPVKEFNAIAPQGLHINFTLGGYC